MLHKELLLLSGNKDLGPVKIRILYYPYNGNKEGFVGYGASNDDYISKVPYWNNKDHDFLDELGAEKMLKKKTMETTLQHIMKIVLELARIMV